MNKVAIPRHCQVHTKNDKDEPVVLKTRHYDLFSFAKWNREINELRLARLKKEIAQNNLLHHHPILVSPLMVVLDGQHRFYAAKELGFEVFFTIADDVTPEGIGHLNANQKAWTLPDWVNYWAEMGLEDYRVLLDFKTKHGIPFSTASDLLTGKDSLAKPIQDGTPKGVGTNVGEGSIKHGRYKVKNYAWAEWIMSLANDYAKIEGCEFAKEGRFIVALQYLTKADKCGFDKYEHKKMLQKAQKYHDVFKAQRTQRDYVLMFERLANFNVALNKQLRFI